MPTTVIGVEEGPQQAKGGSGTFERLGNPMKRRNRAFGRRRLRAARCSTCSPSPSRFPFQCFWPLRSAFVTPGFFNEPNEPRGGWPSSAARGDVDCPALRWAEHNATYDEPPTTIQIHGKELSARWGSTKILPGSSYPIPLNTFRTMALLYTPCPRR